MNHWKAAAADRRDFRQSKTVDDRMPHKRRRGGRDKRFALECKAKDEESVPPWYSEDARKRDLEWHVYYGQRYEKLEGALQAKRSAERKPFLGSSYEYRVVDTETGEVCG